MNKTEKNQSFEDRDILIALQVNVENLKTTMTTGMADMRSDMLEIKTGISQTLTDHESRLRKMERLDDERNLNTMIQQVRDDHRWINDFEAGRRATIALVSLIATVLSVAITSITSYFKVFGPK